MYFPTILDSPNVIGWGGSPRLQKVDKASASVGALSVYQPDILQSDGRDLPGLGIREIRNEFLVDTSPLCAENARVVKSIKTYRTSERSSGFYPRPMLSAVGRT